MSNSGAKRLKVLKLHPGTEHEGPEGLMLEVHYFFISALHGVEG
jgi:hypothetical protein